MSLSRCVAKLLTRFSHSSSGDAVVVVAVTTKPLVTQQQAARRRLWQQPATTNRRHLSSSIHTSAPRPFASAPSLGLSFLGRHFLNHRYATMTTATKSEPEMANTGGKAASTSAAADAAAAAPLFDRSLFDKTLPVPALRVPAQATAGMLRSLRGHTLDLPRMPAVIVDRGDPKKRLVLLSPSEFGEAAAAKPGTSEFLDSLPEPARELAISSEASLTSHEILLTYAHVSVEEALRKLLPPDLKELPSAFETVGHIAHLNLREELLPFSRIIGQVLLDKNPRLRVVVNKLASIQNEFRVFQMEVIAGEEGDTVAEVSQHGCRFGLDYSKVYWNSRLEAEHARLVETEFKPGQVIVDAMAGVGPFAVPAAKFVEGCTVFANDLNPESFKWLRENARRNKVANRVRASCCDARKFIRAFGGVDSEAWESVFGGEKEKEANGGEEANAAKTMRNPPAALIPPAAPPKTGLRYHHVVMNLPATAIEFLDAFEGSLSPEVFSSPAPAPASEEKQGEREEEDGRETGKLLPRVHVYGFEKAGEPPATTISRVASYLGAEPPDAVVRLVRDVSPNKRMVCVSFTLPAGVALAKEGGGGVEAEEALRNKRQKTEGGELRSEGQ